MGIKSKQIEKILAASVRISAFSAAGPDDVVTSVITTALSTAGNDGVSVPLQVSSGANVMGVITASPNNRVEVWNATNKDKINDINGEEVYARLTESGGTYTLTYYSLNPTTGAETAHTLAATNIDFEFGYRFDFERYPSDGGIAVVARNVANDPSGASRPYAEKLNVTALNTIANLAKTPSSNSTLFLIVNGVHYDTFTTAAFSVAGKAITWSAAGAGINVETTDRVIANYFSNE